MFDENLIQRSEELGHYLQSALLKIASPLIKEIRGKGLFIGLELDLQYVKGRDICLQLLDQGLLSYDTHGSVIRLAPPLVISKEQLDDALTILKKVLLASAAKIGF